MIAWNTQVRSDAGDGVGIGWFEENGMLDNSNPTG